MKKLFYFILPLILGACTSPQSNSTATGTTEPVEQAATQADIEILQHTAKTEDFGGSNAVTVHVQLKNNSDQLRDYVQVNATFYDKDGKIVGTGLGNTSNLAAGATRTVDVMAMDVYNAEKYDLDIEDMSF